VELTVVDGYSDPYGWSSLLPASAGASNCAANSGGQLGRIVQLSGILTAPDGMQQLAQHLMQGQLAAGGTQACLVVDCLSPLLDSFGAAAVAHFLHTLQSSPPVSCLLCAVHADLHSAQGIAALEQLAAGTLQLQPATELERSLCAAAHGAEHSPQGRLLLRIRRRTGRVRTETQLYSLDGTGGVDFFDPPPDALAMEAAAERTAATAGALSPPEG
jgi:hypothetical protein